MNTPALPRSPTVSQSLALTPPVFLALSSGLTGVSISQLQPSEDTLKTAQLFYVALCESVPAETLNRLATTFLSACTVTEGAAEVLIDGELAPIGRSIIRLWLTGVWHDPQVPSVPAKRICDHSYRGSSVWRIMQAHPMNDQLFGSSL